jgi:DnaJ-class molecular chaperone
MGPWTVGLILVGCYFISLLLHPYVKCRGCKGTGKQHGAVFAYARRNCHRCSGTGQRRRLGSWILQRGVRTPRSRRIAPRTPPHP